VSPAECLISPRTFHVEAPSTLQQCFCIVSLILCGLTANVWVCRRKHNLTMFGKNHKKSYHAWTFMSLSHFHLKITSNHFLGASWHGVLFSVQVASKNIYLFFYFYMFIKCKRAGLQCVATQLWIFWRKGTLWNQDRSVCSVSPVLCPRRRRV
jgi:hypothetical protein